MSRRRGRGWLLLPVVLGWSCSEPSTSRTSIPEEPSPPFRNVDTPTAFVGDEACTSCHESEASAYATNYMARSFHPWNPAARIETTLDTPIRNEPTGFFYTVVEDDGMLYQVEFIPGEGGRRLHELRRRVDYVMGSGHVARTYFTEENGRLFQLPLTWYRDHGWDFSPGYEVNNARFDRLLPDRCIACHGSYPVPYPFLESKYENLRPGIGCERCHGPGALHVRERTAEVAPDSGYDDTIVNPSRLPLARRLDVCEQCHVHTPVTVLREGEDEFSYRPSQPLQDHAAFFKATGSIDIVSHADRLRQSACFVATLSSGRPLECATCHDPHGAAEPELNQPCLGCHPIAALAAQLAASDALPDHGAEANCVACHMPKVKERAVPHGSFTDHWIRVLTRGSSPERTPAADTGPIEAYYDRDRTGADAAIYRGMGEVVYGSLAGDLRELSSGADALADALGSDPGRAEAQFLLGLARSQLRQTDAAIAALEQSLRLDPDRPQRLHALARAYEASGMTPDSITRVYERALALQPMLAWMRADYAHFLQSEGRQEEAETAYRRALAEQPSLAVATFDLGTLLVEVERLADATETFQRAIGLDPALAEALTPLLEVRVRGGGVTGVAPVVLPLETLPARYRGPDAPQIAPAPDPAARNVRFVNLTPGGFVRILEPDGSVVRDLATGESSVVSWDLLDARNEPVASGLYYAQILTRDASGRPRPPQRLAFGVVRQRGR